MYMHICISIFFKGHRFWSSTYGRVWGPKLVNNSWLNFWSMRVSKPKQNKTHWKPCLKCRLAARTAPHPVPSRYPDIVVKQANKYTHSHSHTQNNCQLMTIPFSNVCRWVSRAARRRQSLTFVLSINSGINSAHLLLKKRNTWFYNCTDRHAQVHICLARL